MQSFLSTAVYGIQVRDIPVPDVLIHPVVTASLPDTIVYAHEKSFDADQFAKIKSTLELVQLGIVDAINLPRILDQAINWQVLDKIFNVFASRWMSMKIQSKNDVCKSLDEYEDSI
ncbi:hypothetical protein C1H46_022710 [Malus baccata]|uniref:Uncharacterized protein n=1 Tax=Malus baccata TaxID=106549 RepID=A0A540LZI2_MALBA|nr:hypothetical protein C1H46_022710 [Malus baccata]